uniref:Anaphase-promoting complex subunit 4 WD40 domain protein n=1 Tax=Mimivirus LCMiAC01 TaxID=2506608 RepID=A0A481Z3A1_9VIRU|nr:MAG: anaphase-promoting complex subunit 4 WD40 domain protein [Mimivirus LCMiAC01]
MNILNLAYNNDTSLLTCGTTDGFYLYKLNKIQKYSYTNTTNSVGIVKMLDRTNISIIVDRMDTGVNSHVLYLLDKKKGEVLVTIDVQEPILNAHVIRNENNIIELIIVLKNKVCRYGQHGDPIDSKNTMDNPNGLCVVNKKIIATLGCNIGDIAIWNIKMDEYNTVNSHNSNITSIALSSDNEYIASASEAGTNVHVYNTNNSEGQKVYSFKRGTFGAKIYDLCFNNDNTHLVCCGNTGTIHVFKLNDDDEKTKNIISKFFRTRSFKKIDIENKDRMICSFDKDNNLNIVVYDGTYYKINGENYEIIKCCNLYVKTEKLSNSK